MVVNGLTSAQRNRTGKRPHHGAQDDLEFLQLKRKTNYCLKRDTYVIKDIFAEELPQIYLESKERLCIGLLGIKQMDQQTNKYTVSAHLCTKETALHMN